jgi:hypothetical protein
VTWNCARCVQSAEAEKRKRRRNVVGLNYEAKTAKWIGLRKGTRPSRGRARSCNDQEPQDKRPWLFLVVSCQRPPLGTLVYKRPQETSVGRGGVRRPYCGCNASSGSAR